MDIKNSIKCILIFIFSFAFITNVYADDVSIESVSLDYNSGEVVINHEPVIDNLTIKFDVKFKNVGDFVKYKVIINNQSNEDYEIIENSSLNTSNYISYSYSYDEQNNIAEKNKKTVLYITISYKNEVPTSELVGGFYTETNNLLLDLGEQIKNPNTGRKIVVSVILILLILVLSLILFKLKRNKRFVFILCIGLLLVPTSIYAYGKLHIKVESKVEIERPSCLSFGSDSWSDIAKNVIANDTDCYHVGDTKTVNMGSLGNHTVRIVNMSTPDECQTNDFSETACGFIVEFTDIITTHYMNDYDDNYNGWRYTLLKNYLINDIVNALPDDLANVLPEPGVVYNLNNGNTRIDYYKLFLLSPTEIYSDGATIDGLGTKTRQLDYYKNLNVSSTNYSNVIKKYNNTNTAWWLRSAVLNNDTSFTGVNNTGLTTDFVATSNIGVSPAFKIDKIIVHTQ